jgi:hypothetical protein
MITLLHRKREGGLWVFLLSQGQDEPRQISLSWERDETALMSLIEASAGYVQGSLSPARAKAILEAPVALPMAFREVHGGWWDAIRPVYG